MNQIWYVASIIMRCVVGEDDHGPWLCDRQIRLVVAKDGDEAYEKALNFGREAEHNYRNSEGEMVRWMMVGIEDIDELVGGSIDDGTEIKSLLFRCRSPQQLVRNRQEVTTAWIEKNNHRTAQEIIDMREYTHRSENE